MPGIWATLLHLANLHLTWSWTVGRYTIFTLGSWINSLRVVMDLGNG